MHLWIAIGSYAVVMLIAAKTSFNLAIKHEEITDPTGEDYFVAMMIGLLWPLAFAFVLGWRVIELFGWFLRTDFLTMAVKAKDKLKRKPEQAYGPTRLYRPDKYKDLGFWAKEWADAEPATAKQATADGMIEILCAELDEDPSEIKAKFTRQLSTKDLTNKILYEHYTQRPRSHCSPGVRTGGSCLKCASEKRAEIKVTRLKKQVRGQGNHPWDWT